MFMSLQNREMLRQDIYEYFLGPFQQLLGFSPTVCSTKLFDDREIGFCLAHVIHYTSYAVVSRLR